MKIVTGDITTAQSGIIVHCCNAQGVMGSGVAAAIRSKWEDVFLDYREVYERDGGLRLGDVHYTSVGEDPECPLYVANLIGQEYFGREPGRVYVSYDAIRKGFKHIANVVKNSGMQITVHFPKLGAGLAGGDWSIIEQIITEELSDDSIEPQLWLFE